MADEFYWAAAELYITTAEEEYKTYLLNSEQFGSADLFDWANTAPLGTISLLSVANELPAAQKAALEQNVLAFAEEMLEIQAGDGYAVLIKGDYPWGSNGLILNNMMLMAVAYQISGEARNLDAVRMSMDYILGRNALTRVLSRATALTRCLIHTTASGRMTRTTGSRRRPPELYLAGRTPIRMTRQPPRPT